MLGFLPLHARAFIFVLVALLGARLFTKAIGFTPEGCRGWFWGWFTLTFAAFFGGSFLVYALFVGVVGNLLARSGPAQRAQAYIVLLPVIPLYAYTVPGAFGINNILVLSHFRVLAIFLLLPAFFQSQVGTRSKTIGNTTDFFFLAYCLWLIVLVLAQRPSPTDMLRGVVEVFLFMLVPFYAMRKLLCTTGTLEKALVAASFAATLVACIGFVEQAFKWSFYDQIPSTLNMDAQGGFTLAQQVRYGLMRIKSSIGGGIGQFCMLSIGATICSYQLKLISRKSFFPLLGLLLVCLVFTGSRGPWISTAVMVAVMMFFRFIQTPARLFLSAGIVAYVIPVAQDMILSISDPFKTFSYRSELFDSSVPVILMKPILGWDSMRQLEASGLLEHMRQGEGIIDIVNTFLGEAMFGGIPRVILFMGILFGCLWSVVRRHTRNLESGDTSVTPIAAYLSGLTIATAMLLVTVSMTGHSMSYVLLMASLCSAFASRAASNDSLSAPGTGRGARQLQRTAGRQHFLVK